MMIYPSKETKVIIMHTKVAMCLSMEDVANMLIEAEELITIDRQAFATLTFRARVAYEAICKLEGWTINPNNWEHCAVEYYSLKEWEKQMGKVA